MMNGSGRFNYRFVYGEMNISSYYFIYIDFDVMGLVQSVWMELHF